MNLEKPLLLRVNLSRGKIKSEPIDEFAATTLLGGRGVNNYYLLRELKPSVEPLSPENKILFSIGPLAGTLAPANARYNVSSKSPLTGFFGDSNAGGFFASELHYAGYHSILIEGRAEKPVYLWINDGNVELRDATNLWGKTTWETQEVIQEELEDRRIQAVCIGPAGENLVRYACIINNLARAAGRTGMGAVLGSKRLKAIAVRGSRNIDVVEPELFMEAAEELRFLMERNPFIRVLSIYGTPFLTTLNELGMFGTRNMQTGVFEEVDKIEGEVFLEKYVTKTKSCFACPIHCSHYFRVPNSNLEGEGVEYAAICSYGAKCGCSDFPTILEADILSNKLGIDIATAGNMIGFVMECYERGILTSTQLDGLNPVWGDSEAILGLLRKIAYREGVGDLLAEGELRAAERMGKGAEYYIQHVKGMSFTDEVRPSKAFSLAFAVASRGADHLRALPFIEIWSPDISEKLFGTRKAVDRLSIEGKGEGVAWFENACALMDALEVCKMPYIMLLLDEAIGLKYKAGHKVGAIRFLSILPAFLVSRLVTLLGKFSASEFRKGEFNVLNLTSKMLYALNGTKLSSGEMLKVGERIVNMERVFNLREGLTRKNDMLPPRVMKEPISIAPKSPVKVCTSKEELEQMLNRYYKVREWKGNNGIPSKKKLEELKLSFLIPIVPQSD